MAIGQATRAYAHASFSSGMVAASQADATIRVSPYHVLRGREGRLRRLDNAPRTFDHPSQSDHSITCLQPNNSINTKKLQTITCHALASHADALV